MENVKLYETHVYTRNLERAVAFYEKIGLELAYFLNERRVAFFWLGDTNQKDQMLGVWEVAEDKFVTSHFAFGIPYEQLLTIPQFLSEREIPLRPSFGLDTSEPIVHSWVPAASYYFLDPDGNSLEYIAVLEGEGKPEFGAVHLSKWEKIKNEKEIVMNDLRSE